MNQNEHVHMQMNHCHALIDTHLDTLLRIQSSFDILDCLVRSIRLSEADASNHERIMYIFGIGIDDL